MECVSSWWTGWWKSSRNTNSALKLCTLLSTIWTASSPAQHMWNAASCSWSAQLRCWLLREYMFIVLLFACPVQYSPWFVPALWCSNNDWQPWYLLSSRKYEEISPPELNEFVYITDSTYTKKQLIQMEHVFLRVLAFKVAAPTANQFLRLFMSIHSVCANTQNLALVKELNLSLGLGPQRLKIHFSICLNHICIYFSSSM